MKRSSISFVSVAIAVVVFLLAPATIFGLRWYGNRINVIPLPIPLFAADELAMPVGDPHPAFGAVMLFTKLMRHPELEPQLAKAISNMHAKVLREEQIPESELQAACNLVKQHHPDVAKKLAADPILARYF